MICMDCSRGKYHGSTSIFSIYLFFVEMATDYIKDGPDDFDHSVL